MPAEKTADAISVARRDQGRFDCVIDPVFPLFASSVAQRFYSGDGSVPGLFHQFAFR